MDAIVDHLFVTGVLRTPAILDAFRAVRREHFVLPEDWRSAEQDTPLPIGYGQTILQPTTVAIMLEWLEPLPGARVLDVGSGSGWTTALLAHIVGPEGIVTGIEVIPDLVALGQQNLRKYNFPHATILPASPRLDLPAAAPFNRILVSATTEKLPQELVDQLTSDGILVIPVGTDLLRVRKQADGAIHTELLPGFLFVPLVK